jgi:hypothetical protein
LSKPLPLQNQFTNGMRRDVPRNRMPSNSAWTLKDIVLEYGAPARERGGWLHHSNSITAATASASYVRGGIYAIFSPTAGANPKNLCVDEDGKLFSVDAGSSTLIGTAVTIVQNPVFHGGAAVSAASAVYTGLVIIPDGTGAAVPKKYDGTSLANLNGSPPTGRYATVYKDYTVLANGTVSSIAYPNRIWFSPPGDPDCFGTAGSTAWDTTDSWIDFSLPVRALASTKNALLVFGDGQVARVRGSIAPPDEDMVVDDPWQKVGILDPFSIQVHQDIVYWCAPEGIYRSDGVYLDDITSKGGMLRYWLDLVSDATSTWTFATGIIRGKLIVSVMDAATIKDAFMVDLNTYAFTQITNLDSLSFWDGRVGVADETYFGRRNGAYVGRLGTMFEVGDSTYKNDGNGTAVASVLETPFYELGRPGIKTVKSIFAGYHLADFGSDNPTIAVSYIDTPESTSYTSLSTLAETTVYDRQRIPVGGRHWGIGLKFTRSNAGDFYGYDLSAEVGFQEESKRMT